MNLPPLPMPLNPFSALPGRAVLASDELDLLAAVKNRLNLAENPIKGSHGQKRACAMQALCHG